MNTAESTSVYYLKSNYIFLNTSFPNNDSAVSLKNIDSVFHTSCRSYLQPKLAATVVPKLISATTAIATAAEKKNQDPQPGRLAATAAATAAATTVTTDTVTTATQ